MEAAKPSDDSLYENFEDFFENALSGFIITNPKGYIVRANKKIAGWVNTSADELKGKRFSNLLTIGGKIYFETHLWPLLRMQGFFDEVVLELSSSDGQKLQVMVNALERRDDDDQPSFIRFTVLKASDRLLYEQNLKELKKTADKELTKQRELVTLREQLIAVLGHDLRNPLSAVIMGVELLETSPDRKDDPLLATLKRSTARMSELVHNIMDFARTRMGEGMVLNRRDSLLEPVLHQVVAEMQLVYPKRSITTSFEITEPVNCDTDRIAELISNLLANALTHGDPDSPVHVHAVHNNGDLKISVSNHGTPIPPDMHDKLFTPFTREKSRPSQNGLGLGLYIASEIARAHNATLSFTSTTKETCFTFSMKTTDT